MVNYPLDYSRYCAEITAETDRIADLVEASDLSVRVPTCPAWDIAGLALHIGQTNRWAAATVRTRATSFVPHATVPDMTPAARDAKTVAAWLRDSAARVVEDLTAAGPDAAVWTGMPVETASFWARRMAHEAVVHHADAAVALGADYQVAPEVAADAIDEWLFVLASPWGSQAAPRLAELRGPGTIALRGTDTAPEIGADWLIELGADGFSWRRGVDESATTTLRGPLVDVLQVFYRRQPADSGRVEVLGDAGLLDAWLERASFG
ncbi:maleylpyruvate isomerase family mycothiol-dependent enzyme [Streptomyces sp. NRRL S-31]|uniref:maleylpyruvate isomerase family mycothiol-dependent enzyme n=1 Tax=Streptomyces sp. NRRL S-31 TaxID=1463898 RepID=UPI0004C98984|nr:maleylpyruvate isomerase family mycothiol-dependent enzyme [Streptomyces sp. NRRL S-31]